MAKKSEKPESTKNTAKATETKPKIDALWAEYGKLQADRERTENMFKAITQSMRAVQQQIQNIK